MIIFISDLHLSEDTPDRNQLFISYLKKWRGNIDALYILGDFFDYWLGNDDKTHFTTMIKNYLKEFTEYTPIYFIGGNHDFAIDDEFAHDTNIKLLSDCSIINIDNTKILISHGDIFCTLDVKYQRMKKVLQNKLVVYLLKKIPLSLRRKLKDKLQKESHEAYNKTKPETYNVVDDAIYQHAKQTNANFVVHGHTHRPGYYLVMSNKNIVPRIEIPDWTKKPYGGFVTYNNNEFNVLYHYE